LRKAEKQTQITQMTRISTDYGSVAVHGIGVQSVWNLRNQWKLCLLFLSISPISVFIEPEVDKAAVQL
jgi:hypothetical protein